MQMQGNNCCTRQEQHSDGPKVVWYIISKQFDLVLNQVLFHKIHLGIKNLKMLSPLYPE